MQEHFHDHMWVDTVCQLHDSMRKKLNNGFAQTALKIAPLEISIAMAPLGAFEDECSSIMGNFKKSLSNATLSSSHGAVMKWPSMEMNFCLWNISIPSTQRRVMKSITRQTRMGQETGIWWLISKEIMQCRRHVEGADAQQPQAKRTALFAKRKTERFPGRAKPSHFGILPDILRSNNVSKL